MRWFKTAHELYTSTEFRELRAALMAERVDSEGVLRCEHCGQPILFDYDCIAHHEKEVTAANLNNAEITLNPANIKLVHLKCHNIIHDRFGYSQKKVYLVVGAPCSGKNTFVNASKGSNDIIVDMDALWQAITGGEKYYKPAALELNVFLLRKCLLEQIKMRTGKWQTAYVITTEPRKSARERLCAAIGAEEIFIKVEKAEALRRLESDETRKNVIPQWTEYINNFFEAVEV